MFVDNGLLRKNEYQDVLKSYENMGLNITGVDASFKFLQQLSGVIDPEHKRKIIGTTFIDVFNAFAADHTDIVWLGQGRFIQMLLSLFRVQEVHLKQLSLIIMSVAYQRLWI